MLWEMAGIYADEGITGTSLEKRTSFKRMLNACRKRIVERVTVKNENTLRILFDGGYEIEMVMPE